MEKKEIGKLYVSNGTVVLCTAVNKVKPTWGKYSTMSGIVVQQEHSIGKYFSPSNLVVGTFSDTWNEQVFEEYTDSITLDNAQWKPMVEIGCSPG